MVRPRAKEEDVPFWNFGEHDTKEEIAPLQALFI